MIRTQKYAVNQKQLLKQNKPVVRNDYARAIRENKDKRQRRQDKQTPDVMEADKSLEQNLKEMLKEMKDDISQQVRELKTGFEKF